MEDATAGHDRTCCCHARVQVSPVEIAAAVREMLAAAAMPLDLERNALLEQGLALQQQLQAARTAVSAEQQVPGLGFPTPFGLVCVDTDGLKLGSRAPLGVCARSNHSAMSLRLVLPPGHKASASSMPRLRRFVTCGVDVLQSHPVAVVEGFPSLL